LITYNPSLLDTRDATVSPCEALESCEAAGAGVSNTVWYRYSPAMSGTIRVDTFGSNYNTVLSIFDGCAGGPGCDQPRELACNDNFFFGETSQVFLSVEAGQTYIIKVSDRDPTDQGGFLDFNLGFLPPNDNCRDATEIIGFASRPPSINTLHATTEPCEALESCEVGAAGVSNSVWYRFRAPCDGTIDLDTEGTAYDTVVSVFDGCGVFVAVDAPCIVPTQIACDDDSGPGPTSRLSNVPVQAGAEYLIKVADYNSLSGGGVLSLHFEFNGANSPVARIDQPGAFACVCEMVEVRGGATAGLGAFVEWRLEYQRTSGGNWSEVARSNTTVTDGLLAVWNTAGLTQDYYLLRLTVENACGLTNTAVAVVWVDKQFDAVDLRAPEPAAIVGGVVCPDGTVFDNLCFTAYAVGYRPLGGMSFNPVNPLDPLYETAVTNDPLVPEGWNTVLAGLPDGHYELQVLGRDDCGHEASVTRRIQIDNSPPIADITSPMSCMFVDGLVNVFGTANDANLREWVLQFTGGDEPGWATIAAGTHPVVNGLLGTWNTNGLPACAYTLRLLVTDHAVVNCDDPHESTDLVSIDAGEPCPVDLDGDGDEDLADYAAFSNCFEGP
jgi:hypothetical protein